MGYKAARWRPVTRLLLQVFPCLDFTYKCVRWWNRGRRLMIVPSVAPELCPFLLFCCNNQFYHPAQLVRGLTGPPATFWMSRGHRCLPFFPQDTRLHLYRAQGSSLSAQGSSLSIFQLSMLLDFHRFLLTFALALPLSRFPLDYSLPSGREAYHQIHKLWNSGYLD